MAFVPRNFTIRKLTEVTEGYKLDTYSITYNCSKTKHRPMKINVPVKNITRNLKKNTDYISTHKCTNACRDTPLTNQWKFWLPIHERRHYFYNIVIFWYRLVSGSANHKLKTALNFHTELKSSNLNHPI
jgi:hypothetical protein